VSQTKDSDVRNTKLFSVLLFYLVQYPQRKRLRVRVHAKNRHFKR